MNNIILTVITIGFFLFQSCSNGSHRADTKLSAAAFAEKMNATPDGIVLDVRTPDEFEKGHLARARNIDWNSSDFQQQVSTIHKSTPLFVYCLSGGRSASAAAQLRADGYTQVYELEGGMLKWEAANPGETTSDTPIGEKGMTLQQFNGLLNRDKLVLVDFYADWCAPCKKMKPYLDEMVTEYEGKVHIVRVNVEANQALCRELGIEEIPVLQVYKQGSLKWNHIGFVEKQKVEEQLQN